MCATFSSCPVRERRRRRSSIAVVAAVLLLLEATHLRAQIDYPDFAAAGSTRGLTLVGSALHVRPALRLTDVGRMQRGAAWYGSKLRLGDGFVTELTFRIYQTGGRRDRSGGNGGDGIAFVIQNQRADALGGAGGNIGYGGISNGFAIEFDTYENDGWDLDANHLGVKPGPRPSPDQATSIAETSAIPALDDGGLHTVTIEYLDGRLRILIDQCLQPAIDIAFDLARQMTLDDGRAWVGLTSSTGDAWEVHDILSWRLNPVLRSDEQERLCIGDTLMLAAPGFYSRYEWSTGETTRSIAVTRGGTYSVNVVDTLGCGERSMRTQWDIEDHTLVRPVLSASDTIRLCDGESVLLDAGCCVTHRWSRGDTARAIEIRTAGLYWVDVIDEWGCRGRSDSVQVLFHPLPRPTVSAAGPREFCRGDSVVLTASEHAAYRWSNGATSRSIVVRETGQYSVEVTDSTGCRATSPPLVVLVLPTPSPIVGFLGPAALCAGAETTLDAGDGYEQYRWSNGDTTRTTRVTEAGLYSVIVTTAKGCSGASPAVQVRVSPLPTPTITRTSSGPLCPGAAVTLAAERPYARYRWSNGDTTASITVDSAGDYSLTVLDSNGCEGAASPIRVDVASGPSAAITADGPLELCAGEQLRLEGPPGLASYVWSTGSNERAIAVASTGRYRLEVTDFNGCVASESVDVFVHPLPVALATVDVSICAGEATVLGASGAESLTWSPAEGLDCVECPAPTARPVRTTTYIVTATGPGGCTASDSVVVTVLPGGSARLVVAPEGRIYPGRKGTVRVYLEGDLDQADADELLLRVDYGRTIMRLESVGLAGPLSGWTLERLAETPGRFTARLSAPAATTLRGTGHALDLEFQTFLGDTTASLIEAALTVVRRPCATVASTPGILRLDSLCGMGTRMIEAFPAALALEQNSPNPFNPSTAITFTLAGDDVIRLTVRDAFGRIVATLADGASSAGRQTVTWDATAHPSGLYLCRLDTRSGSTSIRMLLQK